ncbi:hypothetical protein QET40_07000 [Akkermansia sp. N21169]|uniref:hypothetical protein n=1 Tax=Akkermansia sp. N21169 TaxID=3040765 RepID=UPI00244EA01B|nr:hypothetical protein [Akkermansia sp. N21169]MDH3068861.1 hypothetical protein [Akkermansia sp. N21169]
MYKILVVSLPGSPKREAISARLLEQGLAWEWVDGVRLEAVEEAAPEEYSDLEAYRIPRLKTDPDYIRRAVGCKRAMRNALAWAACCEEEWVVILQDDARVMPEFDVKLRDLLGKAPATAGAVMLHYEGSAVLDCGEWKEVTGDLRSMAAFAVRPSYAEAMEDFLSSWGGEDDRIWAPLVRRGDLILAAKPMLVRTNHKGSDITSGIPELTGYWK